MNAAVETFLTPEELVELTDCKIARTQIEWLKAHRWRFEVGATGRVKVARAHFERKMVGEAKADDPKPVARHNIAALRVVK